MGKLIVVNGAAACGKTTIALELTAALKKAGVNAVYLPEAVRSVFEKRAILGLDGALTRLEQTLVLLRQLEREVRLKRLYDAVVTDNPLFSAVAYGGYSDERMEHELQRSAGADLVIAAPFLKSVESADGIRMEQSEKERLELHTVLDMYLEKHHGGLVMDAVRDASNGGYTDMRHLTCAVQAWLQDQTN
ncbi:AAA family ATPase [Chromobacterium haemolyticum]|uniref:AAA family ATPase n=1 Tax=Chromobacterium TaxID=535 RepID=UPI00405748CD